MSDIERQIAKRVDAFVAELSGLLRKAAMNCITPWPSSIYEIEDPATATGRRLDIPEDALPLSTDGIQIDPVHFNSMDGFSAAAPIITAFETGIDPSNLVSYALKSATKRRSGSDSSTKPRRVATRLERSRAVVRSSGGYAQRWIRAGYLRSKFQVDVTFRCVREYIEQDEVEGHSV